MGLAASRPGPFVSSASFDWPCLLNDVLVGQEGVFQVHFSEPLPYPDFIQDLSVLQEGLVLDDLEARLRSVVYGGADLVAPSESGNSSLSRLAKTVLGMCTGHLGPQCHRQDILVHSLQCRLRLLLAIAPFVVAASEGELLRSFYVTAALTVAATHAGGDALYEFVRGRGQIEALLRSFSLWTPVLVQFCQDQERGPLVAIVTEVLLESRPAGEYLPALLRLQARSVLSLSTDADALREVAAVALRLCLLEGSSAFALATAREALLPELTEMLLPAGGEMRSVHAEALIRSGRHAEAYGFLSDADVALLVQIPAGVLADLPLSPAHYAYLCGHAVGGDWRDLLDLHDRRGNYRAAAHVAYAAPHSTLEERKEALLLAMHFLRQVRRGPWIDAGGAVVSFADVRREYWLVAAALSLHRPQAAHLRETMEALLDANQLWPAYQVLAHYNASSGDLHGERCDCSAEWAMLRDRVAQADHEALAGQFRGAGEGREAALEALSRVIVK